MARRLSEEKGVDYVTGHGEQSTQKTPIDPNLAEMYLSLSLSVSLASTVNKYSISKRREVHNGGDFIDKEFNEKTDDNNLSINNFVSRKQANLMQNMRTLELHELLTRIKEKKNINNQFNN